LPHCLTAAEGMMLENYPSILRYEIPPIYEIFSTMVL